MGGFSVFAPEGLPEVTPGDDLPGLLEDLFVRTPLQDADVVVLAHKIVSKAEGCVLRLDGVSPGPRAEELAEITGKAPALVQVIVEESDEILWADGAGRLICRHRLGHVCASAAVDESNSRPGCVITLPRDPDRSAARLRRALERRFGLRLGVLICDTHGRPFREGACGTAIGASGVRMEKSYVGSVDRAGRRMHSSVECWGDELACAATLALGQGGEGTPVAVVRGLEGAMGDGCAGALLRVPERDVFLQSMRQSTQLCGGRCPV